MCIRDRSMAFDSVRQPSIAVNRSGRCEFECYLNLLMLDFWYRTKYRPPRSNAAEGYGQRSNVVNSRWWRLNACERVPRRQWERCINLGLLTVTYGRAFWDRISYHIAIFCAVSYRIHRFPPRPYRAITIWKLTPNVKILVLSHLWGT